jgi:hypothetical protein
MNWNMWLEVLLVGFFIQRKNDFLISYILLVEFLAIISIMYACCVFFTLSIYITSGGRGYSFSYDIIPIYYWCIENLHNYFALELKALHLKLQTLHMCICVEVQKSRAKKSTAAVSSSREREEVKKSEFFPAVNIYSPSTVQYLCLLNTILKQFRIHSVISHFGNLNAKTRSMLVVL